MLSRSMNVTSRFFNLYDVSTDNLSSEGVLRCATSPRSLSHCQDSWHIVDVPTVTEIIYKVIFVFNS